MVAEFEARIWGGNEVHVPTAQPCHRGTHRILQIQLTDALTNNRLAGDEHAAVIELRAIQLDMSLQRLAENLFGALQAVLFAYGDHNVSPLQPRVAAANVARFPVLNPADYKTGIVVRTKNLLHGS